MVTQADLNNGVVTDTATATGKDPQNVTVTSRPATATVSTPTISCQNGLFYGISTATARRS